MNDEYIPSEGEDHPSDRETDPVKGEGESKLSDRQLLYQEFDSLVTQICQEPSNPWKRRRLVNQLVIKMTNSGLIWKDNVPYYEDALQEQWEFFSSNLWESRTGTQYDRDRGSVMNWFNYYFKRRLQNWVLRIDRENSRRCRGHKKFKDGEQIETIEDLPAEDESHIVKSLQYFEEVQSWIETNQNGVLSEHIRGRKDLTCQVILRSLLSGKTFTTIAAEFACPYPTIYGFYKNKCRPHMQQFRENHDY
ncbi:MULTISPECIES: hypothetical protein [unclassified Microcoleus]|uniref:hypothetical protein n=1 Tax=unclassified Microcoleus TaxID=2642155 RepID=UPI002FD03781